MALNRFFPSEYEIWRSTNQSEEIMEPMSTEIRSTKHIIYTKRFWRDSGSYFDYIANAISGSEGNLPEVDRYDTT